MTDSPLALFPRFCRALKIVSKDKGLVPLNMNGCQKEFVRRLTKAVAGGRRKIIVLKGRQQGLSTICLALDLFWPARFPQVQGGIVTETDDNREFFRATITQYHNNLPEEAKFKIRRHNRSMLLFGNGSVLNYVVAGTKMKKQGGGLGQGKAFNYGHFTEVSSYGDQEDLKRAMGAVLSDKFPDRLYLFESTAKGFNHFYDMWQIAKKSVEWEAIFIPWWLKEEYQAEGPILEVYGGYGLDSDERRWVGDVKRLYGYDINNAQLAWWRKKLAEDNDGNLNLMLQEYPPTEQDAFQATGSAFFSSERLTTNMRRLKTVGIKAKGFRYSFGMEPMDVRLEPTPESQAHLKIWKEPIKDAVYVLGCDPAYGASEWADQFSIQVLRCWGDKIEQVAEFATPSLNTAHFAWVICHLAGYYNGAMYNLELYGGGEATMNEIDNILRHKADFATHITSGNEKLSNILGTIGQYLWRRQDSLAANFARLTKTNEAIKQRYMHLLKNAFELEGIIIHSQDLLREMKVIIEDGGSIEAHGRAKDDRVAALGFALMAWKDWRQEKLRKRRTFWTPDAINLQLAVPKPASPSGWKARDISSFLPLDLQRAVRKLENR